MNRLLKDLLDRPITMSCALLAHGAAFYCLVSQDFVAGMLFLIYGSVLLNGRETR